MFMDRQQVIAAGTYAPDQNARIFDKWIAPPPSHFLRYAIRQYGLGNRSVADMGSAFGHALRRFGPGSYGIEMNPGAAQWAQAMGLTVYRGDFGEVETPPVSAVWCSNVLEHVDSPHLTLRRIARSLEDGGLAFLVLPLTNSGRHLGRFWARFRGYTAADHVSFFNATTLRWTVERGGFEVVELTTGCGKLADALLMGVSPACLVVARKIPGWEYAAKSTRKTVGGMPGRKDITLI